MLLSEMVYRFCVYPWCSNNVYRSLSSGSAAISCRRGLNICSHQKLGADCLTPQGECANECKRMKKGRESPAGVFGPEIDTKNWI